MILKRLILSFFLPFLIFANDFVIGDRDLINQKTFSLINQIGEEFFQKTNISAYVLLYDENLSKEKRQEYLRQISSNLFQPFILLYFFKQDKKIDFLMTQELKDTIDVDMIYKDYIVPLLPLKKSEVLDQGRISAIVLNGYSHLIDSMADSRDVKIFSNIVDKQGELLAKIARSAIKIMLFILAVFVIWFYIFRRGK